MLRAIIVDDEKDSRDVIAAILLEYCPQVDVVGQAENADDAHKLITTKRPDLVFLDIQMQPETGLDLLARFDTFDFQVIFITAWNQYAIEAIKLHALDYLLKPVDIDELVKAVQRANEQATEKKADQQALKRLMSNINLIGITMTEGIEFTPTDQIIRCEANGFYTWFFIENGKKILATKNLKKFEEQLSPLTNFCRIHSSHLININYLKKYVKGEGYVVMTDGAKVPVSRTYKNEFLDKLTDLGII